jgi:hypothetical protein
MLQLALLLLGCVLSGYLWGTDAAVASVTSGVTSVGVPFYLFVVVAGVASKSCPYQKGYSPPAFPVRRAPAPPPHPPSSKTSANGTEGPASLGGSPSPFVAEPTHHLFSGVGCDPFLAGEL